MSKKTEKPSKEMKKCCMFRIVNFGMWIKRRWEDIKKNYRVIWFIMVFTATFTYTTLNWNDCIDFDTIDGNNIIFGLLILLVFIPFISKVIISIGDKKVEIGSAKAASAEALATALSDMAKGESK